MGVGEAVVDLISLGDSFGRMLKDALGTGVMNELTAPHQALGHRDFAPGTESIRHISPVAGGDRLRKGCVGHGRHSR